jgi:HEAT repeat protein
MKKMAFLFALLALPLYADLRSQVTSQDGWTAYMVPLAERGSMYCNDMEVSDLHVLYEVTDRRITSVRVASPRCPDYPRARFLGQADPRESIALLTSLIDNEPDVAKKATMALALHAGTEETLVRIARSHPRASVRSGALFWVGHYAGKKAAGVLRDAVDNDPDEEVKRRAVFAISQLPDERSVPMLIDLMNTHRNREVRKKAAFWLGQKNDPRALEALAAVLLK